MSTKRLPVSAHLYVFNFYYVDRTLQSKRVFFFFFFSPVATPFSSNPAYVSVIYGHDQGSLMSRTMDRAMPQSVRVLYAELPANRFSMGALEAVLDLWANKTIVACLLLIPEPVGLLPALTATKYRVPVLWLPSVQRVDQVSLAYINLIY